MNMTGDYGWQAAWRVETGLVRSTLGLGSGAASGLVLATIVAGVAAATGSATLAPITGTLSKPGYTVIALAANGRATSVRTAGGSFTLRPPAGRVTLQLRAPDGIYAGPVVIASIQNGRRVITGVRAGAKLGRISVNVARGYARVARSVATRWTDTSRWARATKGVPIGNGINFGRVLSPPPRVSPSGDLDADGVPDVFDIARNGTLILNNVEPSTTKRTARAAQDSSQFYLSSNLDVPLWDTESADAGTATDADIDAALVKWETLALAILPGESGA